MKRLSRKIRAYFTIPPPEKTWHPKNLTSVLFDLAISILCVSSHSFSRSGSSKRPVHNLASILGSRSHLFNIAGIPYILDLEKYQMLFRAT